MSWYPLPALRPYEINYLKGIQTVFKVQDSRRKWVKYKLTPHQMEWHRDDVAIQGPWAKNRIVGKSRNTSFTTSALVSSLAANGRYMDQIVPFVRLNQMRANDLISDCKKLINHMEPIVYPDGRYWPFNPELVNMDKVGSIFFEDRGVEFRAFPATASASEIIRGLRISGNAGVMDETNYMREFVNIYIALRDAEAGSDETGTSEFQINMGTTFKGNATNFKLWYDKQLKRRVQSNAIYKWPVFDPKVFNPDLPILEQPDLVPIVHWHSVTKLADKFKETPKQSMEEFMCVISDADDQLYPQELIQKYSTLKARYLINEDLLQKGFDMFKRRHGRRPVEIDDFKEIVENYIGLGGKRPHRSIRFMGVDPAYTNDFFAICIFDKMEHTFDQTLLFWKQKCDPDDMEDLCKIIILLFEPVKCRIDAKGVGFHIGMNLRKEFGTLIEPIRAKNVGGIAKNEKLPFGEYLHTNHIWMMRNDEVNLIEDEMQYIHYGVWNDKYDAPSTEEYGHGDIVIANCLALLPVNWKVRKGFQHITSNMEEVAEVSDKELREIVREFNNSDLKNKIAHYKQQRMRQNRRRR